MKAKIVKKEYEPAKRVFKNEVYEYLHLNNHNSRLPLLVTTKDEKDLVVLIASVSSIENFNAYISNYFVVLNENGCKPTNKIEISNNENCGWRLFKDSITLQND